VEYITGIEQIKNFVTDLSLVDTVAVDTETTGLTCLDNTLILLQVDVNGNQYIFDCRSLGKKFVTYIVELLNEKKCIFHNAKFDIKFLKHNTGIMLSNIYDTMLGEALTTNGLKSIRHDDRDKMSSLKELVKKYFNVDLSKEERNSFIDNPNVIIDLFLFRCKIS
jgi:ribonuclease D